MVKKESNIEFLPRWDVNLEVAECRLLLEHALVINHARVLFPETKVWDKKRRENGWNCFPWCFYTMAWGAEACFDVL